MKVKPRNGNKNADLKFPDSKVIIEKYFIIIFVKILTRKLYKNGTIFEVEMPIISGHNFGVSYLDISSRKHRFKYLQN